MCNELPINVKRIATFDNKCETNCHLANNCETNSYLTDKYFIFNVKRIDTVPINRVFSPTPDPAVPLTLSAARIWQIHVSCLVTSNAQKFVTRSKRKKFWSFEIRFKMTKKYFVTIDFLIFEHQMSQDGTLPPQTVHPIENSIEFQLHLTCFHWFLSQNVSGLTSGSPNAK